MTPRIELPRLQVPDTMSKEEMPDLLRYWYLGTRARQHMVFRRFAEVDGELPELTGLRVLDIGSAWGYNAMALALRGAEATGMDLVVDQFPAGRRIAEANGIDLRAVGGDAARLPFRDGCFDGITMVETFEHIYVDDRLAAFCECCRVLRPGGRLVLSTPNYESAVERFKRVAVHLPWLRRSLPSMCYPAGTLPRDRYHPYSYHRPMSTGEIAGLLTEGGFTVRKVKHFLFVLKNTPDLLLPAALAAEAVLERLPLGRRLAATVCFVAEKS
jgi:2-polyprenyl-3-methyl-5-hydroxy-6-metoxy-1,4-benzoquinol methylase